MGISEKNGIYKIINLINGKIYVGSTFSEGGLKRRWTVHKSGLKHNRHPNKYLQRAWNKYGEESFIFNVVEIVDKSENILIREQFHLDFNQSFNDKIGYNISKNATAPMLGRNHTEESKRKIGKASEGNTYSLGIKASDETKDKMSKSRQNISKKTLEKMSLAKLGNKNAIGNKNSVKSSVYQLDLNNNPIKLWEYVAYAAKTLKLPAPNINKVCKGSRETCGGFKWKYAN